MRQYLNFVSYFSIIQRIKEDYKNSKTSALCLYLNSIDEALSSSQHLELSTTPNSMEYNYNYNYNTWAGIPPNPTLYPNPSSLTMTDLDQSVPQNPNPSLIFGYGHFNGATSSVEATTVYYQDPNVVRLLGSNGPFRLGEVSCNTTVVNYLLSIEHP